MYSLRAPRWVIGPAVLAGMLLCAGCFPLAAVAQEDAASPAPTHYIRTLGPYSIEGANFTVKLSVICYKETRHAGECNEDDEETVKWMKIEDEAGKTQFQRSFPVAFAHQLERHVVEVRRLEGQDHQALEICYERLPSAVNTGASVQLFGLRDGTLQALNDQPLHFYGELGELPVGSSENSFRLLARDALPIYELTDFFYIMQPVTLNWRDFRLDRRQSGEFDVVQQPHYQRNPEVKSDGYVHLYASPNQNAQQVGVSVTPQSRVELLRAIFAEGPPDEHSSPNDTWLQISVDDKVGWILGVDDYTAIGLTAPE
jgi:hypothetical protein